ncbi:hypothetical protein Droror1_Dr00023700 [Drosera rotundifolia]
MIRQYLRLDQAGRIRRVLQREADRAPLAGCPPPTIHPSYHNTPQFPTEEGAEEVDRMPRINSAKEGEQQAWAMNSSLGRAARSKCVGERIFFSSCQERIGSSFLIGPGTRQELRVNKQAGEKLLIRLGRASHSPWARDKLGFLGLHAGNSSRPGRGLFHLVTSWAAGEETQAEERSFVGQEKN